MSDKDYTNSIITSPETPDFLIVTAATSRKTLRKMCKQFKQDKGINGYVSALTSDKTTTIVSYK